MSTITPAGERTNTLAILGLIFAFFFWPLGLVFGHMAWAQIRRTGETGRGLAIAALVIGYLEAAVLIAAVTVLYAQATFSPQ